MASNEASNDDEEYGLNKAQQLLSQMQQQRYCLRDRMMKKKMVSDCEGRGYKEVDGFININSSLIVQARETLRKISKPVTPSSYGLENRPKINITMLKDQTKKQHWIMQSFNTSELSLGNFDVEDNV